MADKTWKRVEREKCRQLGGERRGPTGRDLPDCDDAVKVGLEIKSYKRFVWLTKDWEQAIRNAEKLGLMPVLAVREGGRGGRDEVQLRWGDFRLLTFRSGLCPVVSPREDGTVRIPWDTFVALYLGAYPTTEGDTTV